MSSDENNTPSGNSRMDPGLPPIPSGSSNHPPKRDEPDMSSSTTSSVSGDRPPKKAQKLDPGDDKQPPKSSPNTEHPEQAGGKEGRQEDSHSAPDTEVPISPEDSASPPPGPSVGTSTTPGASATDASASSYSTADPQEPVHIRIIHEGDDAEKLLPESPLPTVIIWCTLCEVGNSNIGKTTSFRKYFNKQYPNA